VSATDPKIEVACPQCQAKLSVPAAAPGKCPRCGRVFLLHAHGPSTAASPDEPDLGSLGAELNALAPPAQPAAGPQPAGWITQPSGDNPQAPTIAGSIASGYMSDAKADYEEQSRRHWDYNRLLGLNRWGIDFQVLVGLGMMLAAVLVFALGLLVFHLGWLLLSIALFPTGVFFLVRGILCSLAMRR
jgi:hypothetical protein